LGDHIRKRRLDLGLRQKDVAATLGVTDSSITGWERNCFNPQTIHLPRIIAFLGYTPSTYDQVEDNIIENLKRYRLTHGLNQMKFAKLLGVNEKTVARWELGDFKPSKKLVEKLSFLSQLPLNK